MFAARRLNLFPRARIRLGPKYFTQTLIDPARAKRAGFYGTCGSLGMWGLTAAAVYDANAKGPETISPSLTASLMMYSALSLRFGWVITPWNPTYFSCQFANLIAQSNQMRQLIQHMIAEGRQDEVMSMVIKGGACLGLMGCCVLAGPKIQKSIVGLNIGALTAISMHEAGPFTVCFYTPMSKWLISGSSLMELDRPTEKISIPQYTALSCVAYFFTGFSLLMHPVNYLFASANVALLGTSLWHLGRKVKADYIDTKAEAKADYQINEN